ncbi:hypothetical protein BGZ46_010743 [Entomortierella lignicola]|nr:hypothetical protein BGZ46_010743 [Entomortierella lignicola]
MLRDLPESFSVSIRGMIRPEFGLKLDQYSVQLADFRQRTPEDFFDQMDIAFYSDASKTIKIFGTSMFGGVVEYQGILDSGKCGYRPGRILEFEWKRNGLDLDGVSQLSSTHTRLAEIGKFGSGGTPKFLFNPEFYYYNLGSCEMSASDNSSIKGIQDEIITLRSLRDSYFPLKNLAWCRVGRAIQQCWYMSTALDKEMGDWLLKISVQAACTLERLQSGALKPLLAVATFMQLSNELGSFLTTLTALSTSLPDIPVSKKLATVCSMVVEAGQGFISAGVFILYTFDPGYENEVNFLRLAGVFYSELVEVCGMMSKMPNWVEKQASCTDNDRQAGHLKENCECSTTCFKPIETTELVLFDIKTKELKVSTFQTRFIAVSQVWFQGIFGQNSRKCGECSIQYLEAVCNNLGVQYVWIDTICMPARNDLRRKVIAQLRQIYMDARAVLVVDAGLISSRVKTALDLSIAIAISDWSSRVWTFQEGKLASKLLFCVRNKVMAVPHTTMPDYLDDPRRWISREMSLGYGTREDSGVPIDLIFDLVNGRKTSHDQDYVYGLSALLPTVPERAENLESVAIEVAKMYNHTRIDLRILRIQCDRCQNDGYRWMPLGAKNWSSVIPIRTMGTITTEGLKCTVRAQIKVMSTTKDLDSNSKVVQYLTLGSSIKYWYSTNLPGVYIGTRVEALNLIFCLLTKFEKDMDLGVGVGGGFLVSPTDQDRVFRYIGDADVIGDAEMLSRTNVTILVI